MTSTQQPFFVRGPSPLARLTAFGLAALVLMFIDSRFRTLDTARSVIATIVQPMQQVALWPIEAWRYSASWFESRHSMQNENTQLKKRALSDSTAVQGFRALEAENAQLWALLNLRKQPGLQGVPAEVLYTGRDPFAQHTFLDRGAQHGIRAGQAVIDSLGVVGQITRAHPLVSEVTLITDKEHAVPVRNDRTGVRFVMFGNGPDRPPELRYVANTVDVMEGDTLTTSGIDGIYPSSLGVAKIASVTKEAGKVFTRVICTPLAGVNSSRNLLVLESPAPIPELPKPEVVDAPKPRRKK
jgi:rod shape-determining protein MreC